MDVVGKSHSVTANPMVTRSALALLGILFVPCRLNAEDVQVDARTDFQVYEVTGPSAPAFLSRRRLVQSVGFRYTDELQTDAAIRWDLRARMRLDHEFGRSCLVAREYCLASTSAEQPDDYLYLSEDARLDLPIASVGLSGLPGRARARLGRQLLTLAHRMRRIDGLALSATPLTSLSLQAHAGFLPLATGFAGSDTFAPQGALDDPTTSTLVDRPRLWSLGASATLRAPAGFSLQAGAEEVGEPAGSVERSLFAGLGWTLKETYVRSLIVWDPSREAIADARAHLQVPVFATQQLALKANAEVVYHRPRFDFGTIWAFFEVAPTTQARAGGDLRWKTGTTVGAHVMSRATHFAQDADQQDYGVNLQLATEVARVRARFSVFSWFGALDHWRGARLHLERALSSDVLARAGLSLWDLSDPTRRVLEGLTTSEYAGLAWRVATGTRFSAELQHGYSDVSGHRWRLMSALSIEVWR